MQPASTQARGWSAGFVSPLFFQEGCGLEARAPAPLPWRSRGPVLPPREPSPVHRINGGLTVEIALDAPPLLAEAADERRQEW